MKTALGTEVELCPGHIVLDGTQLPHERGTAVPPVFGPYLLLFLAHVYCGHGHPSRLLLSSCFTGCQPDLEFTYFLYFHYIITIIRKLLPIITNNNRIAIVNG